MFTFWHSSISRFFLKVICAGDLICISSLLNQILKTPPLLMSFKWILADRLIHLVFCSCLVVFNLKRGSTKYSKLLRRYSFVYTIRCKLSIFSKRSQICWQHFWTQVDTSRDHIWRPVLPHPWTGTFTSGTNTFTSGLLKKCLLQKIVQRYISELNSLFHVNMTFWCTPSLTSSQSFLALEYSY